MKKIFKFIIVFAVLYLPYYFYTRTNFEFDEAIHYSITDVEIDKRDSIFLDSIIYEDFPYQIYDTTFISKLEKNGFKKNQISEKNHSNLKTILRSQFGLGFLISTKCLPTYRDVIILKKDNKISGIAKICFDCDQHYFVGNSLDDSGFFEYEALKKLLYNK